MDHMTIWDIRLKVLGSKGIAAHPCWDHTHERQEASERLDCLIWSQPTGHWLQNWSLFQMSAISDYYLHSQKLT